MALQMPLCQQIWHLRCHFAEIEDLELFLEDYPMAKALLLYRGKERIKLKNILCIPCNEFLKQLKPDQPLWF